MALDTNHNDALQKQEQRRVDALRKQIDMADEMFAEKSFAEEYLFWQKAASFWRMVFPFFSGFTVWACAFFLTFDWDLFKSGGYDASKYMIFSFSFIFIGVGVFVIERVKAESLYKYFVAHFKRKENTKLKVAWAMAFLAVATVTTSIFMSGIGSYKIGYIVVDQKHEIQGSLADKLVQVEEWYAKDTARIFREAEQTMQPYKENLRTLNPKFVTVKERMNLNIEKVLQTRKMNLADSKATYEQRIAKVESGAGVSLNENGDRAVYWAGIGFLSILIGELLNILGVSFIVRYAFQTRQDRLTGNFNLPSGHHTSRSKTALASEGGQWKTAYQKALQEKKKLEAEKHRLIAELNKQEGSGTDDGKDSSQEQPEPTTQPKENGVYDAFEKNAKNPPKRKPSTRKPIEARNTGNKKKEKATERDAQAILACAITLEAELNRKPTSAELLKCMNGKGLIGARSVGKMPKQSFYRAVRGTPYWKKK